MSGKQGSIKARSFNIGKRERVYQGETNMPPKMKYLDFYNAIYKNNALKEYLMELEKYNDFRKKCPIYHFNGNIAFHNEESKLSKSQISLSDVLKHKGDYSYYDKHKEEILQIIPYNSSDTYIRNSSKGIIEKNEKKYSDLIHCCLSFFGLSFCQAREVSIDDSKERKNMFQDKVNCLFMKTLISSLFLYDQNASFILSSYYSDRVDDEDFDFSQPFYLSLVEYKEEEKEKDDDKEEEEDIVVKPGDSKKESKKEKKEEEVVKEIKPPEQHYSINFLNHNYDCVLSKNKHIYESNMVVYKVYSSNSIIKRFQLIEGIANDVLSDIQHFASLNIDRLCKCSLSLSFPKCLFFYSCNHEINLRFTINEHIVNENRFPRELIVSYLYGLLIPIYNMTSIQTPIVHKNINPDNVYFTSNNVVVDRKIFHISGYVESRICPNRLVSRYIAPEVKEGKEVFINCDVYSVAIIMLELLDGWISNGQVGFNADTLAMIGDLKGIFDMMIYPNRQRPDAAHILNMLPK